MSIVWALLFGIAGLAVVGAIIARPALGAALILLLAQFERLLMFGGHSGVKVLTFVCVAAFAVRLLLRRSRLRFDATAVLVFVFLGWVTVTVLWNSSPAGSIETWTSFVIQALLYLLFINLITTEQDLKVALWGQIIGGTGLAIIVTATMVSQNFLRSQELAGFGINLAARMVGLNLLFALLMLQLERGWAARQLLVLAILVSGAGSVVALSRGNWYGIALSLIVFSTVYVVLSPRRPRVHSMLAWLVLGVLAVTLVNGLLLTDHGTSKLATRLYSAVTFSDGASQRFDIWQAAWELFNKSPVWGIGFDTFASENPFFNKAAHNAFVLIGVECGVVGLMLFLGILVSVVQTVWRGFRVYFVRPEIVAWSMALFTFLLVVSMVDSSVDRKYLWYTLAIISLLTRLHPTRPPAPAAAVRQA